MKNILVFIFTINAFLVLADHPSFNLNGKLKVSFCFPDGTEKSVVLTYFKAASILRAKRLPDDLHVDNYKIDWWIFAALRSIDLPFKAITTVKDGNKLTVITEIGQWANGKEGRWIYYVNGVLSKYHISSQLDSNVKSVKYKYVKN